MWAAAANPREDGLSCRGGRISVAVGVERLADGVVHVGLAAANGDSGGEVLL